MLRQLLQKETPWVWLPEHNLDFENTKKALTSPTMLQPFDPNVKTVVLMDASRLYGIGFALVQVYKDRLALIQCGSALLSPTQSRYSTVELECLAIVHAIQKTTITSLESRDLRYGQTTDLWSVHLISIFICCRTNAS